MKLNILTISTLILLIGNSCRKGCTDPAASNFDERAKRDNNSCTYDTSSSDRSNISLMLHHKYDSQNFALNTDFVDDSGNTIQFTRAEFYLSNPVYMDDNMTTIDSPSAYALISLDDSNIDFGTVIGDTHVHMMNFLFGIDSTTNHADPAVNAVDWSDLDYQTPSTHWSWNNGYIFLMLEGNVDIDNNGSYDAGEDFIFHIGTDALSKRTNNIMSHFNSVSGMSHTIHLDIDWAAFIDGIDLSVDNSTHTGNNMPLATIVSDNSADVITIHP